MKILLLLLLLTTSIIAQETQTLWKLSSGVIVPVSSSYNFGISSINYFRVSGGALQFTNNSGNTWNAIPTSLTGGGWTLGSSKVFPTIAGDKVHIRTNAGDTTGTGILNWYGAAQGTSLALGGATIGTNDNLAIGSEKGVKLTTQGTGFTVHTASAIFNTTRDDILYIGYNLQAGTTTTKITAGEPQFNTAIEANYNTGTTNLLEYNWNYKGIDDTNRRALQLAYNRSTNNSTMQFATNLFTVVNDAGDRTPFTIDMATTADVISTKIQNGTAQTSGANDTPIVYIQDSNGASKIEFGARGGIDIYSPMSLLSTNVGLRVRTGMMLAPNNNGFYTLTQDGSGFVPLVKSNTTNDVVINSGGSGKTIFGAGGTNNFMQLDVNGNFFIGYTSDPTSGNKFAVNGSSYFNGATTFTGDLFSLSAKYLYQAGNATTTGSWRQQATTSGSYLLQYRTGGAFANRISVDSSGNSVFSGDLSYSLRHTFIEKTSDYTPAITQNVYTKIAPTFTIVEASDVTVAGDSITVITSGTYFIIISMTVRGANGDDFSFQIRKNGVAVKTMRSTTTGATNYQGVAINYLLPNLVAGDDISLWVTNTASNGDPTISDISVYFRKEHN